MIALSDAQKWWDESFSSSLATNQYLPDPSTMSQFWKKIFPIFSLLSDNIFNTDQYWKRIQRIMGQMSLNNNDIPCPFQRLKQFIPVFFDFVQKLNPKSIQQIFISLECMPKSYDPQTILWNIPSAIQDPRLFLILLDNFYTSKHWIWDALINCDGGCDFIFDRFLPYLTPAPDDLHTDIKKLRFIALNIVTAAFVSHLRFPDSFDSIFPSFLLIIQKGDIEQSVHCFRLLANIFKTHRSNFSTEQFNILVKDFTESAITNPILKPFIGPFILSLQKQEISNSFLVQLLLRNNPDHNNILFIERYLMNNLENPNPIILKILSLSVTDKIYGSVYLHLINSIKSFFSSNISLVASFIQQIIGFVIIAKFHNSKRRTVSMIFDLLKTLSSLGYEWLRNEVSRGASLLLASQMVPLAFVNSLKPSMHCDKSELTKWQKLATDSNFDIKSLLHETPNSIIVPINKNINNNSYDNKPKINNSYSIHPRPPPGVRAAPMRNPRASQRGKISSISKTKSREVKKPFIKNPQNKFFQNCRENQS